MYACKRACLCVCVFLSPSFTLYCRSTQMFVICSMFILDFSFLLSYISLNPRLIFLQLKNELSVLSWLEKKYLQVLEDKPHNYCAHTHRDTHPHLNTYIYIHTHTYAYPPNTHRPTHISLQTHACKMKGAVGNARKVINVKCGYLCWMVVGARAQKKESIMRELGIHV